MDTPFTIFPRELLSCQDLEMRNWTIDMPVMACAMAGWLSNKSGAQPVQRCSSGAAAIH